MPALLTNVQTDLVLDLSTMTNPAAKRWQIHVQPGNVCCADLSLNSATIALRGRWNVATRLHVAPCDIFQRFRLCKNSWLRHIWCEGMFSWQRDQRVLGHVSSSLPPPIFTIQQALKHDSCPFITTATNSLKKMLWNPTRETVVRLGRIQQQLETFRAEANCRWGRPRPNLLLGVLPYPQLRIRLLPMCPYHHHSQRFIGRVSRTQGNTDCFEPVLFSFKRATYWGGHVPDNSGRIITSRRRTSQRK